MVDQVAVAEAEDLAEQPYDSSDTEQVNTAKKKASRRTAERRNVVASLMDKQQGRKWMYGVLEMCHVFQNSFVQGDPYATSFRCGEHNIGLRLLADVMAAAPEQYVTMCKESK